MRGDPASLKRFVDTLLCMSEITGNYREDIAATKLGFLNAVGIIGSWSVRGQVAALNHQRQGGHGYSNGRRNQNSNQNSLTHRDLQGWLADPSVAGK